MAGQVLGTMDAVDLDDRVRSRLAGGLVAWSAVLIATLLLRGPVADLAALYGIEFALHILPLADSVVLFGLAALLGWAGAWLSLTRHLRN